MYTRVLLLLLAFATGCAANLASTDSDDVGSDRVIDMIVRNQGNSPVTAFAWWENGARVPLGEVPAGATLTFTTPYRDRGVVLSLAVLSDRSSGLGDRPEESVLVRPGERLAWTIRGGGFSPDYIRLPPR